MKKLFISQPMNGLEPLEIVKARDDAIAILKNAFEEEIEFIDSYFADAPNTMNPVYWLGKSIEALSNANVAVFIGNWKDSRGCRIEHEIAREYGITILEIL